MLNLREGELFFGIKKSAVSWDGNSKNIPSIQSPLNHQIWKTLWFPHPPVPWLTMKWTVAGAAFKIQYAGHPCPSHSGTVGPGAWLFRVCSGNPSEEKTNRFGWRFGDGWFQIFVYVHPETRGRWTHFDQYWSNGLKPPTSFGVWLLWGGHVRHDKQKLPSLTWIKTTTMLTIWCIFKIYLWQVWCVYFESYTSRFKLTFVSPIWKVNQPLSSGHLNMPERSQVVLQLSWMFSCRYFTIQNWHNPQLSVFFVGDVGCVAEMKHTSPRK